VHALLVDDDADSAAVHLRRLTHDGYHVTAASDSAAALALAKQSQPNVIFVHLGKKGSGSTAFIVSLRAADDTRHIPVHVLSNYYDPTLERLRLTPHSRDSL
jgi:CheY-like chemotaxis protein